MKVKEVIERLLADGWVMVRHDATGHRQFKKAGVVAIITDSGKPSTDIPVGTLGSIKRAAGWSVKPSEDAEPDE